MTPDAVALQAFGDVELWVRPSRYDPEIVSEVLTRDVYFRHFQPQPTQRWIDLGGHVGAFVARVAGRVESVLSFEPDPQSAELFMKNFEHHDWHAKRVSFLDMAAVAEDLSVLETVDVELYVASGKNASLTSLRPTRGRDVVTVPGASLAAHLNVEAATHVKIDVEGGEVDLLPVILDYKPRAIVGEYHHSVIRSPQHYDWVLASLEACFEHVVAPRDPGKRWTTLFWAWDGDGS